MGEEDIHGEAYEAKHVHAVYESIAEHFSGTRYKPWPIVEHFLSALPAGSIGLDIGTGNGKYLPVNRDVFIIASDHSSNLVHIASKHEPHEALVADSLALPHRPKSFDFAISIAVIHHLSTRQRRVQAVAHILELLEDDGRALIYVWALEQKNSRRGWDKGGEQDVLVPWVTKERKVASDNGEQDGMVEEKTYHRYYHLYRESELEEDVEAAGGVTVKAGYEKDNWWAVVAPKR